MKIVLILLLLAYVVAFFWFVYKSAATWRWYQLTSVSIVLLLAVIFLFPLAGVLKSRSSWQKVRSELETRLAASEKEQDRLKYGDPSDPSAGPGLLDVQQELQLLSMEVGRVWHNLRLQNASPQGITLVRPRPQTPEGMPAEPPPAAAAADAPPAIPLVPENIIVYGFAEQVTPAVPVPVPTFYLGEFRVTGSQPNQVTLTPTTELTDAQKQRIGGQAVNWSLYELLPLDGHEPFIAPGSTPTDEQLFGRVHEQMVKALLGQAVRPETLQSYLRDGSRAVANDPPKSRWVKVEFLKPHEDVVDSLDQRGALDGGFFDGSGRAVDSRLQRPGEENNTVSFEVGDQLVVKQEAAQQLIREGTAKLVDEYFVRPLNDYRFALRRLRLRIAAMANRRAELEHEQQVLNDALQATITMLASNQQDRLNLEKDAAQVSKERQAISGYKQTLQERITSTRQELASLYQANLALAHQLEEYHRQLVGQIDARTQVATP